MAAKDAQVTSIAFGGQEIGGFLSYSILQGVPREVVHRSLSGDSACVLPGQPDHGRCVLKLYRDNSDPGQINLRISLANRQVMTCVITYSDGSTDTFDAFCLLFPIAGSKDSTTPVNTSTVTLRVAGPIS